MKIFIDASQQEFCVIEINGNDMCFKKIDTPYKVEAIANYFDEIKNSVNEISSIYVNIGPGSFTGIRAALLYIRTLAMLNKNIQLFSISTFDILKNQFSNQDEFWIKATKNKSFYLNKNNEINVVEKSIQEKKINYEQLAKSFVDFEIFFKPTTVENLQPLYISEPQIGELKK